MHVLAARILRAGGGQQGEDDITEAARNGNTQDNDNENEREHIFRNPVIYAI